MKDQIVCLEGNGARPSHKGDGWKWGGVMYTLNSTEVHCVCYRIGSYYSNFMKSDNPHSGIYKTDICNTLDNKPFSIDDITLKSCTVYMELIEPITAVRNQHVASTGDMWIKEIVNTIVFVATDIG